MAQFPVSNSTLAAHHIALYVQVQYQLSGPVKCKLLKAGINHSYLVTDGTAKYVFRVYSLNWRTDIEIQEEIRLLNLLRANNIPVSYALRDARGNYIQQLEAPEGQRYAVMFSFAEGDKMLNFPADVHYKVGETMARIHQATIHQNLQRVTYTSQVLLTEPFQYLNDYLPNDSPEMSWMLSTQKVLLDVLATADVSKLRQGAVHLDIWFDNMNITTGGDVTLFDFDFCGNGWLILDVAYYILQLHSTEKDETERELKKESFFAGYESITTISDEERGLIPALGVCIYYFYLGTQCQRFENWSNVFLNETHLKRFINLLVKKYYDNEVQN